MLKAFFRLNYNRPRSGFGHENLPTMPDLHAGRGASRHFLRRFQALFCAASILLAPPLAIAGSATARRQMEFGVEMALKGSWREAAFRFERVVEEQPDNGFAWSNLGVARESTGRFEEALEAYQKALELEPRNQQIQENLDRLKAYMATRSQPGYATASQDGKKKEEVKGEKDDGS